jgi:plastocyanin
MNKIMKLNKLLITIGIASFTLASCENELTKNAELTVNVATNNDVTFDGQTITVKKGTPVDFLFSGNPDYLTFYSGESGKEYKYRERTTVDATDVTSSTLKFTLTPQYGNPANILTMYVSDDFPGLDKKNFTADSVLVENHAWKELIPASDFSQTVKNQTFEIDMKSYLGKRIAVAICYRGQSKAVAQTRFTFNNMQITNEMTNGQKTAFTASSFGFTPVNMQNRLNLSDQTSMTSNRAYGTVTNNTAGIWNFKDMNAFFIHSSNANTVLKYSWLVSNLFVVNACSPDTGTGLKNITQSLDTYSYTYNTSGTYTVNFVGTNGNYKQETSVVREYKVVVLE